MKKRAIADVKKIRDDWGTLKHYAKKRGINYYTLRNVIYGLGNSQKIKNTLKKDGYIEDGEMNVKVIKGDSSWVAFVSSKSLDECLNFCRRYKDICEVINDDEAKSLIKKATKLLSQSPRGSNPPLTDRG